MSQILRKLGKRMLRRWPRAFARAKRCYGRATYALAIPHDTDFALFRNFEGQPGLFVDIGANAGQSARSFRIFNHSFDVVSFEPNKLLEPELAYTAQFIGPRFSYRMLGLGSHSTTADLYTPMAHGIPYTPWATTDREQLDKNRQHVEADLGGPFTVATTPIEIARFDDLELRPVAVKIDVEGLELDVLEGMQGTLTRDEPILMLEDSGNAAAVIEFLAKRGFTAYVYDAQRNRLSPELTKAMSSNYFACTPRRLEELVASGVLIGDESNSTNADIMAAGYARCFHTF